MAAPHLLEAVLTDEIFAMAAVRISAAPRPFPTLQAWWNFSEHRSNQVGSTERSTTEYAPQNFHRDLNDFRMFWVYMYLTDVDDECGPHEVLKGSGNYREIAPISWRRRAQYPGFLLSVRLPDSTHRDGRDVSGATATFRGPAGTTFLSNGFNFHRIRYPLTKPRMMFAARFSPSTRLLVYCGSARDGDPIPAEILTKRIKASLVCATRRATCSIGAEPVPFPTPHCCDSWRRSAEPPPKWYLIGWLR